MDETPPESPGRALYVIAALVIVIAGMRAAASWVAPLLLSVFVAMILNRNNCFLSDQINLLKINEIDANRGVV
jgi:predicted PurR-regulated permease PerM